MFAHMSYDDENLHLVFKFNEDYEDDLEIHKSTTIQSLYTHRPALAQPDSVEESNENNAEDDVVRRESEGQDNQLQVEEIEMSNMGRDQAQLEKSGADISALNSDAGASAT